MSILCYVQFGAYQLLMKNMINVIREQRCLSFHSCVLHSLSSFLLTLHHTGIHVTSGFHIPMPSFPRFCLASFFICAVESVWVFFHLSFTFPDSDILNSVTLDSSYFHSSFQNEKNYYWTIQKCSCYIF